MGETSSARAHDIASIRGIGRSCITQTCLDDHGPNITRRWAFVIKLFPLTAYARKPERAQLKLIAETSQYVTLVVAVT